jgi:rfaE bifunctional protein kinase chain/domain
MQYLSSKELDELLNHFNDLHILVVGDFFLDKYLIIDRSLSEWSLETGLEAHQVVQIRNSPGAAGSVTSNLRAMDIRVSAIGVIGDDGNGYELKRSLLKSGVDISSLIEYSDCSTPTYTKPMILESDGIAREIERQDIKNRNPFPSDIENRVVEILRLLAPEVDGVIVVDQAGESNCGVITDRVRSAISELAINFPDLIIAADSRSRIGQFENVILKPNGREVILAFQSNLPEKITQDKIIPYGYSLFKKTKKPVFITLGEAGILVFTKTGCAQVPAVIVEPPIDIVGAGDSCMSAIIASLCSGAEPLKAAFVGTLAASITIQQIGTTGTASASQIRWRFQELESKLKSLQSR